MFRTTDTVLIAVMVAAAALTYKTKHDAENRLREVHRLERSIRYEQDTIAILKADWSLLTQPARLQKLVETYQDQLNLVPSDPRRIVGIDEVPKKELKVEDLLAGQTAKPAQDQTTTGSIAQ
ncbi:MAG: hypothetical protein M9924_13370 [Rhizobiaceae bacterium]|nr:hypothetical protein [Rhizobiaceae bacterium]